MRRLIDRLLSRGDKQMPEKKKWIVEYTDYDCVKPALTPWGASVRSPLAVEIPPGETRAVDLGIAFERPSIIFPARVLLQEGTEYRVDGSMGGLLMGGQNISVTIRNNSKDYLRIESGEAIVNIVFPEGPDGLHRR